MDAFTIEYYFDMYERKVTPFPMHVNGTWTKPEK